MMTTRGAQPRLRRSWPTPPERQILRASLHDGAAAMQAWERFCATTDDLDAIDEPSFRLLPLAWHNLHDHPTFGDRTPVSIESALRLSKGVLRRSWLSNRLQLRTLSEVRQTLAPVTSATIALKGASLAQHAYPSVALRPFGDLDLLVPHAEAAAAIEALQGAGWRSEKVATPVRDLQRVFHAVELRRDNDRLDLHWNVLFARRGPHVDAGFWNRSQPLADESDLRRLAPTDEFFHTVVHGARHSRNAYSWAPLPTLRWVADATMLHRVHAVDWEAVVRLADAFGAALQLVDALGFLEREGFVPVPTEVVEELRSMGGSALRHRLHYDLVLCRPRPWTWQPIPNFRLCRTHRLRRLLDHETRPLATWVRDFVMADLDIQGAAHLPSAILARLRTISRARRTT